jgi:two-component system sensor histidine kinase RegB
MTPAAPEDRPTPVEASWLVRLRWAQIAALFATVAGVRFMLHAPFPLAPLFVVVGTLSAANVLLARSLRRRRGALSEGAIAAHLLLDALGLTVLLSFTGGAMNPFTILYVLQVALGAILAGRRWGLVVTVMVILAFGALLVVRPEQVHVWHSASMFGLHVRGMWLGFALTAGALWFFIDRVVNSLRAREIELAAARLDAERAVRWTALGTLAAGTAHELNTPLGTIAILASELAETLDRGSEQGAQAQRIREEVRRCREILARMRSHAPDAEEPAVVEVDAFVREVVDVWRAANPEDLVRVAADEGGEATFARAGIHRALLNVLDNAAQSQRAAGVRTPIELRAARRGRALVFEVIDRGGGIAPEHAARLGEPFFSTRPEGQGMGLGLFLVRAAAAKHGGRVEAGTTGGVTTVAITLPQG